MATHTVQSNVVPKRLERKVAIITGGDQSIGRGIALRLAAEGADIAFCYRANRSGAEEVVSTITGEAAAAGTPRRALALQADVSGTAQAQNFITPCLGGSGQPTSCSTTPVWSAGPSSGM